MDAMPLVKVSLARKVLTQQTPFLFICISQIKSSSDQTNRVSGIGTFLQAYLQTSKQNPNDCVDTILADCRSKTLQEHLGLLHKKPQQLNLFNIAKTGTRCGKSKLYSDMDVISEYDNLE